MLEVTYQLEQPIFSKNNPIFHVSCLKQILGEKRQTQTECQKHDEGKIIVEQEAILDKQSRKLRN